MSWAINGIKSLRAPAAKVALDAVAHAHVPQEVRDYVAVGIAALAEIHGQDVRVTVSAQGHLCSGADHDVTSAHIEVRKG